MKKILVIASLADSLTNFRGELLADMVKAGFDVHVAAPDLVQTSSSRQKLELLGFTVHNIPLHRTGTNPVGDIYVLWALWRLMLSVRPLVTFAYTPKPVIYGTLAAWLACVSRRYVLITGLGYAFTGPAIGQRGKVKFFIEFLYKHSLRLAHKVFFQNKDDLALFCSRGLLSSNIPSVVVNGSGVDLDSFSVAPFPTGGPHFLLIARLLGDKGVREYVLAAQRIKKIHPEVSFTLVGSLDANPDAVKQSEIDSWVRAGTLSYLGRTKDVRPIIAQCTTYVLPSYREGTPRTVLEAMAMGRPVITSDAPGCRETVIDGYSGFLVPIRSVDALVEAMLHFIHNPDLSRLMGQRSRRYAENKYDVHKVNAVLMHEMNLL